MKSRSTKLLNSFRNVALIAPLAVGLSLSTVAPVFAHDDMTRHDDHAATESTATADEEAAADSLLAATEESLSRYADIADAAAAGYRIGTFKPIRGSQIEQLHAINPEYVADGILLDPDRPEGLVYIKLPDSTILLVGAMFTAPVGEGPTPGGPLTTWHTHYRCADNPKVALPAGVTACASGAEVIAPDVEMLHVWIFAHPDGPFAHNLPLSAALAAAAQLSERIETSQ